MNEKAILRGMEIIEQEQKAKVAPA